MPMSSTTWGDVRDEFRNIFGGRHVWIGEAPV